MKGADSGFYPDHSRFGVGCGFPPYTKRESQPLGLILRRSRVTDRSTLVAVGFVDVMTFSISANTEGAQISCIQHRDGMLDTESYDLVGRMIQGIAGDPFHFFTGVVPRG